MNKNIKKQLVMAAGLMCICVSVTVSAASRLAAQHESHFVLDNDSLEKLYGYPAVYLWVDEYGLKDCAYDALEFIASSGSYGLDPDDYHISLLQQHDVALDSSFENVATHLFDLALTDGLLQLIHDVTVGRLDPGIVDPEWSIPRASFDAVVFLQQALSAGQLKESLHSLIPTSGYYQKLNAAAARYQTYVDRGGWSGIALSPVLRPGDSHRNVIAVRQRLAFEDPELDTPRASKQEYYDAALRRAVERFQRRHSLPGDGIIGASTYRAMNVSAAERLQQIKINLERLRWLPDDLGERYIMVNLANYRLTAVEDDAVKLDMKVIVGNAQRETPSFSSKMTHVILNPKWYIPQKLALGSLIPKQKTNPGYFKRAGIRVFDQVDGEKVEVDAVTVDWRKVNANNFHYSLVQEPGESNALGRVKFVLPNPWKIYLHDTPSKSLFNRNKRNFSAGCIRVEDPDALADFSLRGNDVQQRIPSILESKQSYSTELEQPLSVFAIYATVWPTGNDIVFSPDSYHRDQKMAEYL